MSLDKYRKSSHRPDYTFIALIIVLLCLGLVMILSASVVVGFENYNNNYYFVIKQLYSIGLGLIAFFILSAINYKVYQKTATLFLGVALILSVLVLIPGLGVEVKGAQRWLDFGFVRFQTSEVLKLALVIYLSSWFFQKKEQMKNISSGLVPFFIILGVVAGLVMLQRDLGTTIVLSAIAVGMYFIFGGKIEHIAVIFLVAILITVLMIKFEPYRMTRLTVFLNPNSQELGAGYHINQAMLAIGSGGLWGLGFGGSKQKYLYLPEPHTDSIFAIMSEELGFIRTVFVLLILFLFILKGFSIAKRAPDDFSKLLVSGIMLWIAFQSMLNIAAMLNLVPLTGVTLPLISYGGTSVTIILAALGIVTGVSKYTINPEKSKHVRA